MDKKDLFIKEKLQQDKKIPKDIDDMFKNFKGGDIKMENNSKPKFVFAKVLGIAACMAFAVFVGLTIANNNGQIIKIGEKDKASSREEVELQSNEVKEISFSKLNDILEKELYKGGNVASDNRIKSVNVNGITIYTNEYCEVQGMGYPSEEYRDDIVGYCAYTMEFDNIEGLTLAGSKGEPYGTYKNTLLNGTTFLYHPKTGKIEIGGSLNFVSDKGNNGHDIYDIQINNNLGNEDMFSKIYDLQYKMLASTGGKVTSNNKIKKVFINSIQIDTEDYLKAQGLESTPEGRIEGYCSFTLEFENIEGLTLAGSQGKPHGIVGNRLVEGGPWDYENSKTEYSNEVYSSIIDEYKAAMNDTNYSVETAAAKYPNINKNMMQHYHNEKFKIYYAKYDINKDNYEDLIIYADLGNSNHTIIDVFGNYPYSNGSHDLIKLIDEETLGERSKLEIFDNGIMYLHGSGSATTGVLEFIKMTTNTDHVAEGNKYYYEYDENNNITIYIDEGVKRKTDYSSIDEVVNYYKKDAKVVSPSNLNLIEI